VDKFHWSLHDIDETDIESLIPFVFEYGGWKKKGGKRRRQLFADEAEL